MNVAASFRAPYLVLAALALAPGVVIACSDAAAEPPPAGVAPDGSALPSIEAGVGDSAVDVMDAAREAAPRSCSFDEFCHTALPPGVVLRGVWGDGLGVVWAVSEEGKILRWNGASWSIAHTVAGRLLAIWGSGPTDLWAGGDGGLFHGTGASGDAITWTAVSVPGESRAPICSIWGTGASRVWAVGYGQTGGLDHRVLRFTEAEGRARWSLDPISSRPLAFVSVWGAGDEVWLGAQDELSFPRRAMLFHADGDSWTEIALPGEPNRYPTIIMSAGAATADDVWIFGRDRDSQLVSLRGVRAGAGAFDWSTDPTEPPMPVWAVWGTSRSDTWSVGDYGRVRHWDGKLWTQARITLTDVPFTRSFYAAWGDRKGELWFVGDNVALHGAL